MKLKGHNYLPNTFLRIACYFIQGPLSPRGLEFGHSSKEMCCFYELKTIHDPSQMQDYTKITY